MASETAVPRGGGTAQGEVASVGRNGKSIEIRVKTLNDSTHQVKLKQSATVVDLKQLLHTETGVDVDRQKLIFQGKVLLNEKDINFYAIKDGMTIHMVERMTTTVSSPGPSEDARFGSNSSRGRSRSRRSRSRGRRSPPRGILEFLLNADSPTLFSEMGDGYVLGARVDLNERADAPSMHSILSNLFGLGSGNSISIDNSNNITQNNENNTGTNPDVRVTGRINRRAVPFLPLPFPSEPASSSRNSTSINANNTGNNNTSTNRSVTGNTDDAAGNHNRGPGIAVLTRIRSATESAGRNTRHSSRSTSTGDGQSNTSTDNVLDRVHTRRRRLLRVPLIRSPRPQPEIAMNRSARRLRSSIDTADRSFDAFERQYLHTRSNTVSDQGSSGSASVQHQSMNLQSLGDNVANAASTIRGMLPLLDRMAVTLRTHHRRLELLGNNNVETESEGNAGRSSANASERLRQLETEQLRNLLVEPLRNMSQVFSLLSELSMSVNHHLNDTRRNDINVNSGRTASDFEDSVLMRILNGDGSRTSEGIRDFRRPQQLRNRYLSTRAPRSNREVAAAVRLPTSNSNPTAELQTVDTGNRNRSSQQQQESQQQQQQDNVNSSSSIWDIFRQILSPSPSPTRSTMTNANGGNNNTSANNQSRNSNRQGDGPGVEFMPGPSLQGDNVRMAPVPPRRSVVVAEETRQSRLKRKRPSSSSSSVTDKSSGKGKRKKR